MIFDQQTDQSGQQTARVLRAYSMPAFVKTASQQAIRGDDKQTLYADPERRRFPIHSPEAVCVSTAYLFEQQTKFKPEEFDRIYASLRKAAEAFNVVEDVERIAYEASCTHNPALWPDEVFGYIDSEGNRYWPMRSKEEVLKAAEYFVTYASEMPVDVRQTFASNIIRRANDCGIAEVDDRIVKSATLLAPSAQFGSVSHQFIVPVSHLVRLIRHALNVLSPNTPHYQVLQKLLAYLNSNPSLTQEQTAKLTHAITTIYQKNNLQYPKGLDEKSLTSPVSVPEWDVLKTAEVVDFYNDLVINGSSGLVYSFKDVVANIPRDVLESAFGDELIKDACDDSGKLDGRRFSELLQRTNYGETFDSIAKEFSVKPIGKLKMAFSVRDLL